MKKLKKTIFVMMLFLCLFLQLIVTVDASATQIYSHKDMGEWVIDPNLHKFTKAIPLFDGMVLVRTDTQKWGIIKSNISDEQNASDIDKPFFIKAEYDEIIIPDTKAAFERASNMFIAKKDIYDEDNDTCTIHGTNDECKDVVYFFDKYGNILLGADYTDGYLFINGYAWVKNTAGLWGTINLKGRAATKFIYKQCYPLSNGAALVSLIDANVWVTVDGRGKILTTLGLLEGARTPESTTHTAIATSLGYAIQVFSVEDNKGNKVFGAASVGSDGVFNTDDDDDIIPIGKYTFIDIINGVFVVNTKTGANTLYGLVDLDGNEFVPCEYSEILDGPTGTPTSINSDGYAILKSKKGTYGVASTEKLLFEADYDEINVEKVTLSGNDYYVVTTVKDKNSNNEIKNVYFFDDNFDYVLTNPFPTFERDPATGYQIVSKFISEKGKRLYGVEDRYGSEVIKFEYDALSFFINGYAVTVKDEFYGIVKMNGEEALGNIVMDIIPWKDSGFINYQHCIAQSKDHYVYIDGKPCYLWSLIETEPLYEITLNLDKKQQITKIQKNSLRLIKKDLISLLSKDEKRNKDNINQVNTIVGYYDKLMLDFRSSYIKSDSIIWQSMDSRIATVDTKGNITGHAPGLTSIILFNLTTGINTIQPINVVVPAKKVIVLPKKAILRIDVDKNGNLREAQPINSICDIKYDMTSVSDIFPVDATNMIINAKNPTKGVPVIELIEENTKVKALSAGKAKVTVTEPFGRKKANMNVYVYALPVDVGIKYKKHIYEAKTEESAKDEAKANSGGAMVQRGKTIQLKAAFPSNNTKDNNLKKKLKMHKDDKVVLWESSNSNILRVNEKGKVTGILNGTAFVRVTTVNGLTAIIQVKVGDGTGTESSFVDNDKSVWISKHSLYDAYDKNKIDGNFEIPSVAIRSTNLNKMHVEIEGYNEIIIELDPYINAIAPNFTDFMKNQMYAGNSLTDDKAEEFMKTIVTALNNALNEKNSVLGMLDWKLMSDGKVALFMKNGKGFNVRGCSAFAQYDTIGHGFLHMFFGLGGDNSGDFIDDFEY